MKQESGMYLSRNLETKLLILFRDRLMFLIKGKISNQIYYLSHLCFKSWGSFQRIWRIPNEKSKFDDEDYSYGWYARWDK